jgi:hypothetical protein
MPQHVPPSIPCVLATAVLPPSAAEAAVEMAVAEVATGGEAMVVEITAETEAKVGAYNNNHKAAAIAADRSRGGGNSVSRGSSEDGVRGGGNDISANSFINNGGR